MAPPQLGHADGAGLVPVAREVANAPPHLAGLKMQPPLKRLVAQQVVDVLDQVIALVLFDQVQRPGKGGNDDALKKERANAHVERRQIREIE